MGRIQLMVLHHAVLRQKFMARIGRVELCAFPILVAVPQRVSGSVNSKKTPSADIICINRLLCQSIIPLTVHIRRRKAST